MTPTTYLPRPGTLDTTFDVGGIEPGLQIISLSPFLNISEGIGIQTGAGCSCAYQIIVGGDAVQQANPNEPLPSCPPTTPTIDGFVDERGWALCRLNNDGSIDRSFGPNGNGKVYYENPSYVDLVTAQHGILVDSSNRIVYTGSAETAASASYGPPVDNIVPAGQVGYAPTGFPGITPPPNCNFVVGTDPISGNPYGQTQLVVGRFLSNGSGLDPSFGNDGLFQLPLIGGPNSLGDSSNASVFDSSGNIVTVGVSTPDNHGCFYGYPLVLRLKTNGTLDSSFNSTGYVVEGNGTSDTSNFTDTTVSPSVNLGYAQYEAVAIHNNGGKYQGYIVAVGDGDLNEQEWPFTSRIIVARYQPNGKLDTTFGNKGRLVISAQSASLQKQLLSRAVAIDANDNIYVGGDIADNNSGPPGETTVSTTAPTVLLNRPSANWLLIKLNSSGKPQNYGPTPACTACFSSTFDSCNSCTLYYNNGSGNQSFSAVTTDFKGYDDAIFDLNINNAKGVITAAGQAAQDAALQSIVIAFAQYQLSTGDLNPNWGTGGQLLVPGGRNRRSLVRNMIVDPNGFFLASGQSGFSQEEITITNFIDSTEKDFAVVRVNP